MRLIVKTREKANELAGEWLPPCRPCHLSKEEITQQQQEKFQNKQEEVNDNHNNGKLKYDNIEIEGLVKREESIKAPLFNVTDGSMINQEDIGKIIEKVFGIKVDFVSFFVFNTFVLFFFFFIPATYNLSPYLCCHSISHPVARTGSRLFAKVKEIY